MSNLNIPSNVKNEELIELGDENRRALSSRKMYIGAMVHRKNTTAFAKKWCRAELYSFEPRSKRPNSFLARSHPSGCRACRRPHLYLLIGER